jgi:hypothetical protein
MRKTVFAAAFSLLPLLATAAERPADLVLSGGNVVTLEAARPQATALAVRGGRVVALGSDAEMKPCSARDPQIDLQADGVCLASPTPMST